MQLWHWALALQASFKLPQKFFTQTRPPEFSETCPYLINWKKNKEQKKNVKNKVLIVDVFAQDVDCIDAGGEVEAHLAEIQIFNSGSYLSEPLVKMHLLHVVRWC